MFTLLSGLQIEQNQVCHLSETPFGYLTTTAGGKARQTPVSNSQTATQTGGLRSLIQFTIVQPILDNNSNGGEFMREEPSYAAHSVAVVPQREVTTMIHGAAQ